MNLRQWNINWLLIIIFAMLLLLLNLFILNAVGKVQRGVLLWLVFLPVGIIILIFFLLEHLKIRYSKHSR